MKNTGFNVGVVVPPDRFNKPVLYSDAKASKDFAILNRDIYESQKRAKKLNEKKTPKAVIIAGLAALISVPFIRKMIKR